MDEDATEEKGGLKTTGRETLSRRETEICCPSFPSRQMHHDRWILGSSAVGTGVVDC